MPCVPLARRQSPCADPRERERSCGKGFAAVRATFQQGAEIPVSRLRSGKGPDRTLFCLDLHAARHSYVYGRVKGSSGMPACQEGRVETAGARHFFLVAQAQSPHTAIDKHADERKRLDTERRISSQLLLPHNTIQPYCGPSRHVPRTCNVCPPAQAKTNDREPTPLYARPHCQQTLGSQLPPSHQTLSLYPPLKASTVLKSRAPLHCAFPPEGDAPPRIQEEGRAREKKRQTFPIRQRHDLVPADIVRVHVEGKEPLREHAGDDVRAPARASAAENAETLGDLPGGLRSLAWIDSS